MTERDVDLRERSGSVNGGPFETMLYILMRDGDVSPGRLEAIMSELDGYNTFQLSNGWLANYAHYVVKRLIGSQQSI